ncbi:Aste57867_11642 [Aphanomyces stellatus]|uniref:Aste57867_11642 protein n=1 Tax=Aphanomyces stellatus TaxID=120398 RepID=A0A485KTJ2_9STRA|nr:hypothetical protein As57867_011599 [Aphanomyces stellatus]VFT88500.1 Aste57867_11642 [Aphanomyces stellatus]
MSSDLFADWHEEQHEREHNPRVPAPAPRGEYQSPYMNVVASSNPYANVTSDDDEPIKPQAGKAAAPRAAVGGKLANQKPMFELREHGFKVSRRKNFTPRCMSVGNGVVAMGSAEGNVLRCTVESTDATPQGIEEIIVEPKASIVSIYLDPSGGHMLFSLENGSNYYLHTSTNRPRKISKVQGRITCVAWDRQHGSPANSEAILIGTDAGAIFEAEFDGKEKKMNCVYAINKQGAIAGLEFEHVDAQKIYVMMTTSGAIQRPTRMYQFLGGPSFGALFAQYQSSDSLRFQEIQGDITSAQLSVFAKHERERAKCFGVLTAQGVFHGEFAISARSSIDNIWTNCDIMSFPVNQGEKSPNLPLSIAMTEYHVVLLFSKFVQVLCRLDGSIVLEEQFDPRVGTVNGLAYDATFNTFWIISERRILEILCLDEDRHIWSMYLNKALHHVLQKSSQDVQRDFDRAVAACRDMATRQKVWTAQADAHFEREEYDVAAKLYAKSSRSFEEVALRFMEAKATNALHTFLLQKLELTSVDDKTQATVLCTWLVELFLDKFNDLTMGGEHDVERTIDLHANLLFEFKQFLQDHKRHLDPATTFNLIASHGRTDELVFFAGLIEDYEKVVTYHIHRGEYGAAIELLRGAPTQKVEELYYKYSPELIVAKPKEVFEAWKAAETLDPTRLIPSIVRHVHQKDGNARSILELAINFLKFALEQGNRDETIHNYIVFLLAKHPDERLLIKFLRRRPDAAPPLFDPAFALRLCNQHEKNRACIYIYSSMGLYQEAVEKALQVDVKIAKEMANMPEDADVKKTLWTLIAKHTIDAGGDIKEAMTILKESELLLIEDILPFFPDFVVINDFKKEICESLQAYNDRIEQLKSEMREYTDSAELIRDDMQKLRKRSAFVSGNQRCDLTGENILGKEFYLFPCGHAFHASALRQEMQKHLNSFQRQTVKQLIQKLQELSVDAGNEPSAYQRAWNALTAANSSNADKTTEAMAAMKAGNTNEREMVQQKLDEIVAAECIFCGEVMIKSIHLPFITEEDEAREGADWSWASARDDALSGSMSSVHHRLQRLGSTRGMHQTESKGDLSSAGGGMRKDRNTSFTFSRQGSIRVTTANKSLKASIMGLRKGGKGTTDVKQLMEDVYVEMDRQRMHGMIKIPFKFTAFYSEDMMVAFVKACMHHADTFLSLRQLERSVTHPPSTPPTDPTSPQTTSSTGMTTIMAASLLMTDGGGAFQKAATCHAESGANLAKSYSRLVLHCSNFERHEEDRAFFEAVYYFVCAVVKTNHTPDLWQPLEEELGYAFRGQVFNANARSYLHPAPPSPQPTPPKSTATRFGQPVASSAGDTADPKFRTGGTTTVYGSYGQNVTLGAIVTRVDATKARVDHNIQVAQAIRSRIVHQHADDRRARAQLEHEYDGRNERRAAARLSHLLDLPLNPPTSPEPPHNIHSPRSPRPAAVSMRQSLEARSPVVASLLPSPRDQVTIARHKLVESSHPPLSPRPPTTTTDAATRPLLPCFNDIHGLTAN